MLKLAAVNIGSNAIRMQITHVIEYEGTTTFKRLEYVRFPLRLGQDVFERVGRKPLTPHRSGAGGQVFEADAGLQAAHRLVRGG